MQIEAERYHIIYNTDTDIIEWKGMLDLRGKESYQAIENLLDGAVKASTSGTITLDLRQLEFLNSSGITILGGFIIKIRNTGGIRLAIKCASRHTWQCRSMTGLKPLMPEGLTLTFE